MSSIEYRKLPGKARTPFGTWALYLGGGHLLSVRSTRITEEYQRFYLQDIESITVMETWPFHYTWAMILLAAVFAAASITREWMWPAGIAGLSALFLWLRGPSCACFLQTATSRIRLRSLHRLKTAQRVIAILWKEIEAVQGRVLEHPDLAPLPEMPSIPPLPAAKALRPSRRLDALVLFSFTGIETVLVAIWMSTRIPWLEATVGVLTFIEFLLIVVVLIRQIDTMTPGSIRTVTFGAILRWVTVQSISTVYAYKTIMIDRTANSIHLLAVGPKAVAYLTLVSLFATSVAGLVVTTRAND